MEYFHLFNIEPSFNIDLLKLEHKYLEFQKLYHPDNIDNNNDISLILKLNKAYEVLKDDIMRAEYILSSYNIKIDNEFINSYCQDLIKSIFLEREQIDDAAEEDKLKELLSIHNNKYHEFKINFAINFENILKHATIREDTLIQLGKIFIEMKYTRKILEEIDNKICS